jgi:TetR/AcrR family transcriptional regulator, transcriptional repressor for nem operon
MMSEVTDSSSGHARADVRPGKRERLTGAAVQLLHQQGIEKTTLAEIAKVADVPAGNVYYYFKTKDEVIDAVVEAHTEQIRALLASIDARHRSPKPRLKALVSELASQSEAVAQHGCPLGSLCSELDKRGVEAGVGVVELLGLPLRWAEEQFRAMGRRDARELALDLIAAYEGSALLANTLRDPNLLANASRRLDRWIDSL